MGTTITRQQLQATELIAIVGPTASGKSDLAMLLARELDGEIICADSQTVRRGMDIGTAKPSAADRRAIPHHLLDIIDPYETFTAAQFKTLANSAIRDIRRRGKVPIIVGGTGLYIDAVVFDYEFYGSADKQMRQELQEATIAELQELLATKGVPLPENKLNKRHLVRALEAGGLKVATYDNIGPGTIMVGILPESHELVRRIEMRIDKMIANGLFQEIDKVLATYGYPVTKVAAIGYNLAIEQLRQNGTIDVETFKHDFKKADRQYAKRQITWFKRNPHIIWFTSAETAANHLLADPVH